MLAGSPCRKQIRGLRQLSRLYRYADPQPAQHPPEVVATTTEALDELDSKFSITERDTRSGLSDVSSFMRHPDDFASETHEVQANMEADVRISLVYIYIDI